MSQSLLILDGGLATELEEKGFHIQEDPLWSAKIMYTNPEAIKDVHYRYLQCGSDVITTATYQASIEGFNKHLGLKAEEAEALLMSGVHLARETARDFMSSCTAAGGAQDDLGERLAVKSPCLAKVFIPLRSSA